MSISHVFSDYPHHVIDLIGFFHKMDIDNVDFHILISDDTDKCSYSDIEIDNVYFYKKFDDILINLNKSNPDLVVFHSLFDYEQWLGLILNKICSRSIWVNWGAELYKHVVCQEPNITLKNKAKLTVELWLKRLTLLRFKKVIALTKGDAELISEKMWRKTVHTLSYPMMNSEDKFAYRKSNKSGPYRIICGNSGDPSNNHYDLINSLSAYKNENIEIYMPLNYGGTVDYIDSISRHGERIFSDKFKPILQFMKKEEYDQLLENMDICVFFHDRQQGLYVAISMLLQGKPIYIKKPVSSYKEFATMGIHIDDSNALPSTSFSEFVYIADDDAQKNSEIAAGNFTAAPLKKLWHTLLITASS